MYDNRQRRGIRTSTTVDPKRIAEDISYSVRTLEPEATPFQSAVLSGLIRKGPPPKGDKVSVMMEHLSGNIDHVSEVTLGTGGYERFARLTVDQILRPTTRSQMLYYPQDKFFLISTEQVVEVVMTPNAAIEIDGTEISLPTALTGNTSTRSAEGTIVVRNVNPYPILPFTSGHVVFMGRTIYESQDIEGPSYQEDPIWDCNYVEHKEKTFSITEDQRYLIQLHGKADWDDHQTKTIRALKREVEETLFFGKREYNLDVSGRPTRHMMGLHEAIRTNVVHYSPSQVTDFEYLFSNFLYESAFRYNPDGVKSKIIYCGARFLFDFNMAFRDFRRTADLSVLKNDIGFNLDTYVLPGGFKVAITRADILSQDTEMSYWAYVIDPAQAEMRVKKDYEVIMWKMPNSRVYNLTVEWQGTVAWHIEQSFALLRT